MGSCPNSTPPIAIIGMGFRLPGGVSTDEDFWNLLINKKSGKCRVPIDRYNVDGFYGDKTQQQTVATEYGYFLDTDIKGCDTSFFPLKRNEVDVTDPQLRLLLEVVWECMESAGQVNLQGTKTGVFAGVFGEDWHNMLHRDNQMPNTYRVLSAGDYALSNMLSYQFDFTGPSMTIRTACSSSLSSLHIACQALHNGDCSAAIVTGSSMIFDPTMTLDMSEQGVLSSSGCCKTFDADADGFARGEAINALLIKTLDDAIRDGDPIRGIIRSTAVNSDGKTQHIGTPSSEAQIALIKRAYEVAGITDVSQTPFVECHGTGTMRGDPIEATAVGGAFGDRGTYIGSVKTNLGHGEGAAAITSIIKSVLALENKTIPPNINFTTPNPKIPFQEYNLKVPVEPVPWPADRHERISISSFGFGGANGHIIIDSAASFGIGSHTEGAKQLESAPSRFIDEVSSNSSDEVIVDTPVSSTGSCKTVEVLEDAAQLAAITGELPRLIPISANSENAIRNRLINLQNYIKAHSGSIDDIVYTLGLRRVHLTHRAFAIMSNGTTEPLEFSAPKKVTVTPGKDHKVVFIFTGQGAQWPGMGKELIRSSPTVLEDIRQMDRALQQLTEPPPWTLEDVLCGSDESSKESIQKAEFAQPLCTAVQVALVNFLTRCGTTPGAVIGHSSGEIAAAYSAGALTMTEAIVTAYLRGLAAKCLTRSGGMAAIGLGRDAVLPHLVNGVQIACENSPQSVTISGNLEAVEEALESIKSKHPDMLARKLHVNVAYHSTHMCDIGDEYEEMLKPHLTATHEPRCSFYSTVTGGVLTGDSQFGPSYWKSNLQSPVLFSTAMQHLLDDLKDIGAMVEIGPHPALQGPVRQIFQARRSEHPPSYMSTLVRNKESAGSVLTTIGQLYNCGFEVDFAFINPQASVVTDLPNYPWDHTAEMWRESRLSKAWRLRSFPHHELLGTRCAETTESDALWRNVLHQYNVPWLRDHKLGKDIIFPAAGYISIMGEAIRQVLGSEGYILQDVIVKSALVVPETEPVEIMTSMRPYRLTGLTNSSSWYELSVSTFNTNCWVENCIAKGKALVDEGKQEGLQRKISPLPRKISENYFYDRMQHIGFTYGPRFRGLRNISTNTDVQHAVATMRNDKDEQEAHYAIHPTTLDHCIQLAVVAGCKGLARNLDTLALPVDISQITIRPGGSDLIAEANIDLENSCANITAVCESTNELLVELKHGRCIPFNNGGLSNNRDILHAARIEWLPDIECFDPKGLIKRESDTRAICVAIEKVALASILQVLDELKSLETSASGHLAKHVSWLEKERQAISQDPETQHWSSMDPKSRQSLIDSFVTEVEAHGNTNATGIAKMLRKIAQRDSVEAIFTESKNPMELCMEDGGMTDYYNFTSMRASPNDYLRLCSHSKPTLNVLEVGAGTGATTEAVLKSLIGKDGARMYSRYVFTDLSAGFFVPAKERFKSWEAIDFKVLDMEKDPAEQDFELGSFDLIIASNVLHATSSIHNTLKNVRALLRPGGRLYLQELTTPLNWRTLNFITGLFSGWWLGANDARPDIPCISVERWNEELVTAGFSGNDTVTLDDDAPYYILAHLTSTAVAPMGEETTTDTANTMTFLYKKEKHEFGLRLADQLEQEGVPVQWVRLGDAEQYVEGHDVISTVELEGPFFEEISETNYKAFMGFISQVKGGVMWLTRSAQIGSTTPGYGVGIGFIRTIRIELGLDFWTVELQILDQGTGTAAAAVCRKFRNRIPLDAGFDNEYSIHDGIVRVGRYHWTSTGDELEASSGTQGPKQLTIGQYGASESLHWAQSDPVDLKSHEVEMEIRCVGLNFKDILTAMGVVYDSRDSLGIEATGVITRVGSAVTDLSVGDRVFTLWSGLFTTRKVMLAKYVLPLLDGLSFEEAATMPIAYSTAMHALVNLGQLQRGQSVLIHSAAGGVGQAALYISQVIGAEIYATVGSDEKVQYLMDHYNLPRERILNSRNDKFLDGIMELTNHRGVDLVLNSLAGDLLQASWQCVAKNGKMMEIGKRDMLERGRVALNMFQCNRTFYGIDLRTMDPDVVLRLLKQFIALATKDNLRPIRPIHTFTFDKILDAFRFMKKGQHIGKIVVAMPEDPNEIPAIRDSQSHLLSNTSTYLLVGGVGGLGREVVRWMVEKGARSICILSPSAGDPKHQAFYEELQSQGCRITPVSGSVVELGDIERAIASAPTPIVGILQMSMVLRDLPLLQIGYDDWRAVQDPKVKGTWNLHNAFLGTKLDFFILMSSLVGIIGQPGQANYAAANTFLDSFSQYRHSLGLPCSVINLGGVEGIGFLTNKPAKLQQYKTSGLFLLQEQHVTESIQIAMKWSTAPEVLGPSGPLTSYSSIPQLAVGLRSVRALSDPRNVVLFKGDVRFSLYNNMDTGDSGDSESKDDGLREFLTQVEADPSILNGPDVLERISVEIGRTLYKFLMLPEEEMNTASTLESIGVDSLVSIEIRNWWRRSLGVDITVLEIMNAGTIEGLGRLALTALKNKHGVESDQVEPESKEEVAEEGDVK